MATVARSSSAEARAPAADILLAALDPSGRAWSARSDSDWDALPWTWMIERARHHKILALLLWRLRASGTEELLPEATQLMLGREREQVLEKSAQAARTLDMLVALGAELRSEFFLIKGGLLAQEVYGDPAMRVSSDVDIVVPRERVDDFDRALRGLGYFFWAAPQVHRDLPRWFLREAPDGEVRGSKAEGRRAMDAFHRHYLYVLKKGDPRLPVEVHWHLFVPGDSSATEGDIWKRTRAVEIGGHPIRALDREATLLHCAVHALEGGPEKHRLLHLADVLWIIHRWGRTMDLGALQHLARAWGTGSRLTAALEGARNVFPFPLPDAVAETWPNRSGRARHALASAGLGTGIIEIERANNRLRRFLAATWAEAMWEGSWGHAPQMAWQRVRRLFASRLLRREPPTFAKRENDEAR